MPKQKQTKVKVTRTKKLKDEDEVQVEDVQENEDIQEDQEINQEINENEDINEDDINEDEINEEVPEEKTKTKAKKTPKQTSKKTTKKQAKKQEVDKDSSDISEMNEDEPLSDAFNYDTKKESTGENDQDEELSEEYIQTVLLDKVYKYIKLDDVIKEKQSEHRKEMKVIKEAKEQLEQYLIGYLDKVDEEYIQIGNKSTLVKTETKTKAPPKMEDISVCLIEGFREHGIYEDDAEIKRVVTDFIKNIEEKREVKTRKYLKRTKGEEDKKGGKKGKEKKEAKNDKESKETNNIKEKKKDIKQVVKAKKK